MNTLFEIAGAATVALATALAALFLLGLGLVTRYRRRRRPLWPRATLLCLKFFYSPLRSLFERTGDPIVVDEALVESVDAIMRDRFRSAGARRMIFLPQCLRGPKCKATLDSSRGFLCKECGACAIAAITKEGRRNGYAVFIVPGDSFVKRIVRSERPDAVIGIACHEELSMALLAGMRMGVVCAGVLLSRSGCYCTEVDVRKVIDILDGKV